MKNEVDIKSAYLMSSEFGLRSGKSMIKILIEGGSNKMERSRHFLLKSLIGEVTNLPNFSQLGELW